MPVEKLNLIVGAVSCVKYAERLQACLSSWIAELEDNSAIRVVQVLGDAEQRDRHDFDRDRNRLTLGCPDTYEALAQKSQLFFEWVLRETDATHVFKCDDDTYINVPKFLAYELGAHDYVGFPMTQPELSFRYGSGGAGYFLSRRAMECLVRSAKLAAEAYEDLGVGRCLFEAGILLHPEMKLVPSQNIWAHDHLAFEEEKLPSPAFIRGHVTMHLHRMSPEAMTEVHRLRLES